MHTWDAIRKPLSPTAANGDSQFCWHISIFLYPFTISRWVCKHNHFVLLGLFGFFFGRATWHVSPLHWKYGVLTTGPPGKSLAWSLFPSFTETQFMDNNSHSLDSSIIHYSQKVKTTEMSINS